jgi:N-acylglucosamine-6-phosphate 2-epimerase
MGGARAVRLEGAKNIAVVRRVTELPIIGLTKSGLVPEQERLRRVYITATFREAEAIAEAGADIIAIDATSRPRPDQSSLKELIERIHRELNKPIMADISTLTEGIYAVKAGADAVSTTLCGYTEETKQPLEQGPAFELLRSLVGAVDVPIILEGRVWTPEEVRTAFTYGAYAVVVGSAITRPQLITERFVRAIPATTINKTAKIE